MSAPTPIPLAAPWPIVDLGEIDSTQAEAQRRAAAGERGPVWINAAVQTQGRGRSGRSWASFTGNLAATLLFQPDCPAALLPQLSLVTGIATFDAVQLHLNRGPVAPPLSLKWPNDLLIGDAKLAGILIESRVQGQDIVALAGIGINIAKAPDIAGRRLTCLAAYAADPPKPGALLADISRHLQGWLEVWAKGAGFPLIRAAWTARAMPEGTEMIVNAGDGPVHGAFAGLDIDGALLLLEPTGHRRHFSWGDVTLPGPSV